MEAIVYNPADNPCTPGCPNRAAGCAGSCARWAEYALRRAERYKQRETLYKGEEALKSTHSRKYRKRPMI